MDKLQAMQVFVQVVDSGGFSRAADSLNMPKATVSTLIQNLERLLKVKLLHRTTRKVNVTADGAGYYERCLRILADVKDTEESVSRTQSSPSGRLRVDVPSGLGRQLIIPALPDFFSRYPDIRLEMGSGDRQVDLVEEGIDCALRGGVLADSTLIARRVGALYFSTCAAPSYLARFGRPLHPRDLLEHRCVNYFSSKTGKIFEWDFAKDGERIQLALDGPLAVNDSEAYLAAGIAGIGIMQTPQFSLQRHVALGSLEPILMEWVSDPLPLHVIYPQNRHLSAKVRVFVEWIAELFASVDAM
jgi:LysR family transcriptional regulator for bpeEF and oprC